MLLVLWFWTATLLAALAVWPLVARVLPKLPAGGWSAARPLSLVLVGWPCWLLARIGLLPFGSLSILLVLGAVTALLWVVPAARSRRPALPGPSAWRLEILLFALFCLFAFIRAQVPAVEGQEKPMDFAFFRSFLRGGEIPPADPWLSGGTINYYYLGYLLASLPGRIPGIPPEIGFNLLVTFVPVVLAGAIAETAWGATGKRSAGLLAAALVVVAGPLSGTMQLVRGARLTALDWWAPSRTVVDTITEFPSFSFLLGDLHPHYFGLLLIAGALPLLYRASTAGLAPLWPTLPLTALVIGAMGPTNPWDLPTQLALLAVALILLRRGGIRGVVAAGVVALLAVAAFLPFYLDFAPPAKGMGLVAAGRRTSLSGILLYAAPFLLTIAWTGGKGLLAAARRRLPAYPEAAWAILPAAILVPWALLGSWGPALVAFCLIASAVMLLADDEPFPWLLACAGTACFLFTEVAYFRDSYGDQLFRMNTVFKYWYQGWLLTGAATGMLAVRKLRWRPLSIPAVCFALLAAAAMVYPVGATISRANRFSGSPTLDGMAFMDRDHPGERKAIDWLNRTYPGRVVIAEATGDPYGYFSRVSTFTGQQTILGWGNHEGLWRANYSMVSERTNEVRELYTSADRERVRSILAARGVDLIYFGGLEAKTYGEEGLPRLKSWFPVAYEGYGVTILKGAR
jgi:YYY domain-containing protein